MTRHPINPNLTIHNEDNYLGFPIQVDKGPFILEYLQGLHVTMTRAIGQYSRVFAFRFDLHFPSSMSLYNVANDNAVIDRFIESFKAKIRHDRYMASRVNKSAHDTVVRYVWTREAGGRLGRPHYHFAIFLNYDAYCAIGTFELGRENMFNRILEAWAGSLGLQAQDALGSVMIPKNPRYQINRGDDASFVSFFHRASYMCKAATKVFGYGYHGFGASRV